MDVDELRNRTLALFDLYDNHPLTLLSLSDLNTHEWVILLLYAIVLFFSFATNLIAIVVFTLGRRSRSGLSIFLLNLSVFNIIMTVYCIPFTITSPPSSSDDGSFRTRCVSSSMPSSDSRSPVFFSR